MKRIRKIRDYFRGFTKEQRFRTISTHPKASQRYATEVQKFIAVRHNQEFTVPKPKPSFSLKFLEKFQ